MSYKNFSKKTLDEVHKQSNEKIIEVNGKKHRLNRKDMSGNERWGTSSSDLVRIIEVLRSKQLPILMPRKAPLCGYIRISKQIFTCFKGATHLYFMYCSHAVIILFRTGLCKSAFSTYSLIKLVFRLFVF